MSRRLIVLLQSLLAVIEPRAFTRSLAEDDLRLELNRQLAEAPEDSKKGFLVKGEYYIIDRATLLRRKLVSAFVLLVGAALVGLSVRWLGCMGWGAQSNVGNTVMERADDFILRALYALGTFFGVLAATWY